MAELYNYMVQPVMTERVKQGLISSLLDLGISVTCFKHKNLAKVASVNHDCASKIAIIHEFIMVNLSIFSYESPSLRQTPAQVFIRSTGWGADSNSIG